MAISTAANQPINVNLIPGKSAPPVVHLSQYDNGAGRPILFNIFDGASAFTIPSDVSVTLEVTKPDKKGYTVSCSKSGSKVTAGSYTNQLTVLSGTFNGQLVLTKTDGSRVGTIPLVFDIVPAGISEDTVISESVLPAIAAAQDAYNKLNARLEAVIQAASTDTEVIDIRGGADEIAYPTAGTAVRTQFRNIKQDLETGNVIQYIENFPFVTATSHILGTVRRNRSTISAITNGLEVVRADESTSVLSFGCYFAVDTTAAGSNAGHKIYVSISGLDNSGTTAPFSSYRIWGTSNGTVVADLNENFTNNSFEKLVELSSNIGQLNIAQYTTTAAVPGDKFTIASAQWIDLTAMFGAGNEPTLEQFKTVYTQMPYAFRNPDYIIGTQKTELLLMELRDRGFYDVSVVENQSEVPATTTKYVLVLHNDSNYGNGGPCWFEEMPYTLDGYPRSNGTRVYPIVGQGSLPSNTVPMGKMLDLISTYCGNTDLIYGSTETLFHDTTSNQINCSAFISAILNGIPYGESRYVKDTNRMVSPLCDTWYGPRTTITSSMVWARQEALWFAENGLLFDIQKTGTRLNLKPGDILFLKDGREISELNYLGIGHVGIVLAVAPQRIVFAQGGGVLSDLLNVNAESTVCKISNLIVSDENIKNYFCAFARPSYAPYNDASYSALDYIVDDQYRFNVDLIPMRYIDENGSVNGSSRQAASDVFYEVAPGRKITVTTPSSGFTARIAEYDENKTFIRLNTTNSITVGDGTKFVRFAMYNANTDVNNGAVTLANARAFTATMKVPTKGVTGIPVETSGEVISINDSIGEMAPDSMVINLVPHQEGSGDPSPDNVRPITGYTGVEVTRTGKNLFRTNNFSNGNMTIAYDRKTGAVHITGTTSAMSLQIDFLSSAPFFDNLKFTDDSTPIVATAVLSDTTNINGVYFGYYTKDNAAKQFQGDKSGNTYTGRSNFPAGVRSLRTWISLLDGTFDFTMYIQYERGTTATEFEPYTAQTYPITFPTEAGTVYGGTLNPLTGELVVDMASVTLENVTASDITGLTDLTDFYRVDYYPLRTLAKPNTIFRSDNFKSVTGLPTGAYQVGFSTNITVTRCFISLPAEFNSVDSFVAEINRIKPKICYTLATPLTYTLTPAEVELLTGSNTIWMDADGTIDLTYNVDIKTYIDSKIAELQALL